MTATLITRPQKFIGSSRDKKPTGAPIGSEFYAHNTRKSFRTHDGKNYRIESHGIPTIQMRDWWLLEGNIGSDVKRVSGTHIRASNGLYTNPDTGLITTVGNDIPRFESVGGLNAILLEPAGTNVCLRSREFDHGAWVQTGTLSPTANETGIDGAANAAYTLTGNDGGAFEYITQDITVLNDSNTHCGYVFIKKDTDETRFMEFQVRVTDGAERAHGVQLNTKTGALNNRVDDGTDSYGVIDRGGWWQLWVNITNNSSGNVTLRIFIFPAVTTIWGVIQLAATGSIIIDAAQVELNKNISSSFIFTTTAAASRATESGYPLWTLPAGLFDSQGTCSVWVRFGYDMALNDTHSGLVAVRDLGASLLYNRNTGNQITITDGPSNVSVILVGTADTWYKFVVKWGYDVGGNDKYNVGYDSGAGISWATEATFDGSYTLGTNLRLAFGLFGPMHIRDLRLYDRVLTDAEINVGGSP